MEPIKHPLYVSLVMLAAGLLLVLVWWLIPPQDAVYPRFFHGLLFGLATLLVSVGGFAAFCIVPVYLINFVCEPRGVKAPPDRLARGKG